MGMRRSSSVLVGRDEDLRALEAALEDRAARPLILVGGEAGVGKSRCVAELVARSSADALATVGSCIQLGAEVLPYAPFVDGLGRFVEALGDRATEVLGAAPEVLATLLPDPAASHPTTDGVSRGRMYEAVRELLDRAPGGLLFVLEDIHWADRSSLELLAYLASRLRHGRTAIVVTFRTDELHRRHPLVPVLAELTRSGRTTRVDLGRLDGGQVGALVRAIRVDAPESLVEAIAGRSDGNPFLVEELLAADAGPTSSLPGTLRELLLARLGTLAEPSRRVLGIVAAIGRPADTELVEAAWHGSADELDGALREAIDRAILVVEPSGGRLAFRHALIGEAVADDLLPGERVRLHAVLARILAGRPDLASPTRAGATAEIAHHLFEAHDLAAALAAAVTAGDAAVAARAYPEARELYERALDLLERAPDDGGRAPVDRIHLLDAAAEASFHSGDAARAVALGRQAVAASDEASDAARMAYLIGRLLEWSAGTGELEDLAALGERAVGLMPPDPPTVDRALVLLSLASAKMHAGHHRRSLELARESERVAVACGAIGHEASARALVAVSLAGLGRDREAVEMVDQAVRLAEGSRGTTETGITHINQAAVYSVTGRFTDLPAVLATAHMAVDREGLHDMSEAWLATDEVDLLVWQGRWSEAEVLAGRMIDAHPSPSPRAWHHIVRGQLRVRGGRISEGERDLRAACDVMPPVEPEIRARALGHLAEAALARGDPRGAVLLVDEALAVLAPTDEIPGRVHLFALGLRAAADLAERARARRDAAAEAEAAVAAEPYIAGILAAREGRLVEAGQLGVGSRHAWRWGWPKRAVGPVPGTPRRGPRRRRRSPRSASHTWRPAAATARRGRSSPAGATGNGWSRSCAMLGPGRPASGPNHSAAMSNPWPGAHGSTLPSRHHPKMPSRRRKALRSRRPTRTASARGSATCSPSWWMAGRTARSGRACSSARRRPAPT